MGDPGAQRSAIVGLRAACPARTSDGASKTRTTHAEQRSSEVFASARERLRTAPCVFELGSRGSISSSARHAQAAACVVEQVRRYERARRLRATSATDQRCRSAPCRTCGHAVFAVRGPERDVARSVDGTADKRRARVEAVAARAIEHRHRAEQARGGRAMRATGAHTWAAGIGRRSLRRANPASAADRRARLARSTNCEARLRRVPRACARGTRIRGQSGTAPAPRRTRRRPRCVGRAAAATRP